jgi:trk system potassium uptake protein TrkH
LPGIFFRIRSLKHSEKVYLFSYFIILIAVGTLMLWLWGKPTRVALIDALFTATSAVCVTGLITINTAEFGFWGQLIILLLIQAGGLGLISFSTIYLVLPGRRLSLKDRQAIRSFSIDSVEHEPVKIVRQITLFTLAVEALGALLLYFFFKKTIDGDVIFVSVFHSVSAFCNAGFSLFETNLERFAGQAGVSLTVAALIIFGGLGFIVFLDIGRNILGLRREISYHTKIVFLSTALLIVAGTFLYFTFESGGSLRGTTVGQRFLASFFQAVTPRTAGFSTIPQQSLSLPSKLITLPLMFIGGSSGSIAGGIKVTTFFLVVLMLVKERDLNGEVLFYNRKLTSQILGDAAVFAGRALLLLFLSIFLLTVTEHVIFPKNGISFFSLVFECFSAFGTVGLSQGVTSSLSSAGKLVIILTMFAGRVGLISMAIGLPEKYPASQIDYPRGEVLIG